MKIVTSKQMQKIDEEAIKKYRISRLELMENAGRAVVEVLSSVIPSKHVIPNEVRDLKVLILAGKGNNAGDGFVVARLLSDKGVDVCVCLTTAEKEFKGETKKNYQRLKRIPITIFSYSKKEFSEKLSQTDLVIDALFGTGIHSNLNSYYCELIQTLNKKNVLVLSIDIPSGVDGDTGKIMGEAVRATWSVTFGLPKIGLLMPPGSDYVGKLAVRNIGFPEKLLASVSSSVSYLQGKDICPLPKKDRSAHKGTFGHALIVAGSPGKSGAAVMAVQSAFRSGVGLVTLLTHPKSLKIIASQVKESFLESFATNQNNYKKYIKNKNAIAIGPGIGFSKEAQNLVKWTLAYSKVPVVLDADALTILANVIPEKSGIQTKAPLILTPHPGEMARLLGKTTQEVQKDRVGVAMSFSKKYKVYLVLKGAGTVIATPDGKATINSTGNPAMATAGMGDVLTGMIVSFLTQGMKVEEAIKLAVYLHGAIADQWVFKTKATRGLLASDVIKSLPAAIEKFF